MTKLYYSFLKYPRHGRRYSLKIDGELHDAADLVDFGALYNPSNLHRDASKAGQQVATQLDAEVVLVKHLKDHDREERVFWPARRVTA